MDAGARARRDCLEFGKRARDIASPRLAAIGLVASKFRGSREAFGCGLDDRSIQPRSMHNEGAVDRDRKHRQKRIVGVITDDVDASRYTYGHNGDKGRGLSCRLIHCIEHRAYRGYVGGIDSSFDLRPWSGQPGRE